MTCLIKVRARDIVIPEAGVSDRWYRWVCSCGALSDEFLHYRTAQRDYERHCDEVPVQSLAWRWH